MEVTQSDRCTAAKFKAEPIASMLFTSPKVIKRMIGVFQHQKWKNKQADWERFIEIVIGVAGEGGEVLNFLNSLKADIVTA